MKMTVSQAMVECLKAENVKVVFGYPGAAICPFYDALLDAENDIRQVLVRQEANGGHAANGYARISGKPAVCIATSVRVQPILLLQLLPLMRILYLSCA